MRIANLSPAMMPGTRVLPITVMKTCEALALRGHEVVLFAGRLPGWVEDVHGYYGCAKVFDVVPVPIERWVGVDRLRYSTSVARRVGPLGPFDAIFGRDIVAVALAPRGVPFALETHSPPRNRPIKLLQRWMMRRPAWRGFVVENQFLRRQYLDIHPHLGPADVRVAYNAGDPWEVGPPVRPSWWPGRPGRMQAGYVGSLRPSKGIGMLLRIAERVPDVDVHIVGGTDAEIAAWRGQASAENIHFHGAVPPGRLDEYYAALDCFLSPPERPIPVASGLMFWQLSFKLFQYMAIGRAICVSDNPVVREVVEHDRSALLLPPGDVDAWVSALRTLASDPARRDVLGRLANETLRSRFTWDLRARMILEMFEHTRTVA